MWSTKEIWIFIAGAQSFHTLSHIVFMLDGILPMRFFGIKITKKANFWIIIINLIITAALFWHIAKMG